MYVIDFRPDIDLLDIRWTGLFTVEGVADYSRVLHADFLRHGFRPGYRLRIDMSESAVQTRDVVDAFLRHMAGFPKASRIAIVTPSAILRMQVRRLMTQPYLAVFDTPLPALEWLLSDELAVLDPA